VNIPIEKEKLWNFLQRTDRLIMLSSVFLNCKNYSVFDKFNTKRRRALHLKKRFQKQQNKTVQLGIANKPSITIETSPVALAQKKVNLHYRRPLIMAVTKHYRVNGKDVYTVTYTKKWNGKYKINCSQHPHNSKSTNVNDCHLYGNGEVCVTSGKEPRTLDKAQAIGLAFCEGYSQHIRTGRFPNGAKRVNV
jgi:hypothetical protein